MNSVSRRHRGPGFPLRRQCGSARVVMLATLAMIAVGNLLAQEITSVISIDGSLSVRIDGGSLLDLGPATEYALSPDRTKLAVLISEYPDSELTILGTGYGRVYLYYIFDSMTEQITVVHRFENPPNARIPFYRPEFSPDGRVAILDAGTSPFRGKTVTNVQTSPFHSFNFTTLGDEYFFFEKGIIFNEVTFADVFTGGMGEILSISVVDYAGNSRVLFEGSITDEYEFLSVSETRIEIRHRHLKYTPPNPETGSPPRMELLSEETIVLDSSFNRQ